jgi:hypothetical protein
MKKVRLQAEDLKVESFATAEAGAVRGTVQAHNTWDICQYTMDPANLQCYSYAVECPPSRVPTNCTDSQPTNYYCDSCRDSVTACWE